MHPSSFAGVTLGIHIFSLYVECFHVLISALAILGGRHICMQDPDVPGEDLEVGRIRKWDSSSSKVKQLPEASRHAAGTGKPVHPSRGKPAGALLPEHVDGESRTPATCLLLGRVRVCSHSKLPHQAWAGVARQATSMPVLEERDSSWLQLCWLSLEGRASQG